MTDAAADALLTDIAAVGAGKPDDIAAILMRYEAEVRRRQEQLRLIRQAILEHMAAAGIDAIPTGPTTELRAVTDKTTKCVDNAAAADRLLAAVGGDIRRFAECLAAGAFKPGACRGVLDVGEYSRLFETTVKQTLEEKPVPKKRLAEVDKRFLIGASHDNGD